MGFRFYNPNPIYRSYFLSKLSPNHKTLNPSSSSTTTLLLIQSLQGLGTSAPLNDNPLYKIPKRWHLGHSHDRHSGKEGENIFRLGLAADVGLATGKALTGCLTGSTAIVADAAHSISDVVLSGVALWSFKAGKAPKDKEHPYGHGKFETLGALGISCMLLATAGGIAWHALDLLLGLLSMAPEVVNHSHEHVHGHLGGGHHHGINMDHPVLALSMTVVSISVKEGLYWITKRAGERQGSGLMKANAWHHRADAISSVVALIGVGGAILGVKFLDPLAGLFVSGLILKAGLETGYQSVLELVDAAIPQELLDPMRQTIVQVEGVKGCHRLRGRKAGSSLYLDVHIEVDPFSSVSAAHGIGENVRHAIHKSHSEIAEVFIHIDPSFLPIPPVMIRPQHLEGAENQQRGTSLEDKDIELIVSNVFLSKFPGKMEVEHITRHLLQGKIFLQIEVSMPPNILILIRDAMEVAEEAEKEILKAASNTVQVSLQLRLGRPLRKFVHPSLVHFFSGGRV